MKLFLHTERYPVSQELMYHGSWWTFDATNKVLEIFDPVLSDRIGKRTVIMVLADDQFTVEACDSACTLHQSASDGEKVVRMPDGRNIISVPPNAGL